MGNGIGTICVMKQQFSIEDFNRFGERYGIDYRFPRRLACRNPGGDGHIILQGSVEEMMLPSGISLTSSDVRILRPYESTSLHCSPLYMLIVLEGRVAVRLKQRQFEVNAGMALITRLGEPMMLKTRHQADNHLRTMTLALHPDKMQPGLMASALQDTWERLEIDNGVSRLPDYVITGLRQALDHTSPGLTRQLLLEGVMLQALGCSLAANPTAFPQTPPVEPGVRGRLEHVRRRLEQQPEKDYRLPDLAHFAAMSPTSLTSKFRRHYGLSVFDYLRDCRLALAHRYLQQGYTVQQAAWMSGYQHATNFATAFRRRYGVAPSAIRANA